MIDSLVRFHFHQSFWLDAYITPADVPIAIVINIGFGAKSHVENILSNPSNDFVLCIEDIHDESSGLRLLLLKFLLSYNQLALFFSLIMNVLFLPSFLRHDVFIISF
jgi:hypothetical protein